MIFKQYQPILLFLFSFFAWQNNSIANEVMNEGPIKQTEKDEIASNTKQFEGNLVAINVGVDLSGLEHSAQQISQSIETLSQTLQQAVTDPDLDPQQKQNMQESFTQLSQLAVTFQQSLQQLPHLVKQTTPPIINAASDFLAQTQLVILITLIAIILLLVAALWAVYYFIIKPTHKMLVVTTSKLDNMATAMANSTYLLESTQQQQDAILQRIETLQQTTNKN